MGFGQGLSGLNAAAQNLDVIGNNVANSATVGFKSSSASFSDVFAASSVGLGVSVAAITNDYTVGATNTAASPYNLAITGTNGFFRMTDSNGTVSYTRNGQFHKDENNFIVDDSGHSLTGYPVGGVGQAPIALQVPQGSIPPVASTTIGVTANLDADHDVIPATPVFDPADKTTFSAQQPATVYDSLGNSHQLTQYFAKRAGTATQSNYDVYYVFDGKVTSATPTPISFDSSGRLLPTTVPNTVTITGIGAGTAGPPVVPITSPAADLVLTFNYTGSTQFGGSDDIKLDPSGNSAGNFTGLSVGTDGSIMGSYSNGKSQLIGTVALAGFVNQNGLKAVGGNQFVETADSGPATLGQPGSNGLSNIKGTALEGSNVVISNELVNMIIAQRTYQANAQTIKTQDQVLQTLLQIQ
jgi:flagellar hook protein FlgE